MTVRSGGASPMLKCVAKVIEGFLYCDSYWIGGFDIGTSAIASESGQGRSPVVSDEELRSLLARLEAVFTETNRDV